MALARRYDSSFFAWKFAVYTALLLATSAQITMGQVEQREIAAGWRLRGIPPCDSLSPAVLQDAASPEDYDAWRPIGEMPAMVHDVLLERGEIEMPWLPGKAEACRWVAEQDWLYAVDFTADRPQAAARLRFCGLDTIVDVYLNGRKIATHTNMYLPLIVDVTGCLEAQNSLVLHFHTVFDPHDENRRWLRRWGDQPVRRPRQNYSSYLGPQPLFSRVGVYDRVWLELSDGHRLDEVVVDSALDESLAAGTVTIDFSGSSGASEVHIQTRLISPAGQTVATANSDVAVEDGRFAGRSMLEIDKPELWWPRGYGGQPLYRAETALIVGGQPQETRVRTVGFRRVTMPQRLHFVVNGVPVRLWGGDWVTPHWRTAVWDPSRVARLIEMAEHANFNAFRVWGVVESPRDDFYELADRRGFLLWQDFTDLPLGADQQSITASCDEATRMIKRLKNHPSILVWCGCNEAAMWNDQEFNGQLEDRGPWPGLAAAEAVGEVCHRLDPDRYYQPSTPYFGIDPNDPQQGNTHGYTNMWFVPGYDYLNFASEDTRIAAPVLHSMQRFMRPEDIWPEDYSPVYKHGDILPYPASWRKYTTGSSWKKTGPVELFYDATDAESLVHRIGMAEALYYQDTIERQRRGRAADDPSNRRRCGGYLVWKFNDSWPQIYSGKVDYFLEPYHVYYTLRRAYAPVLLSFDKGVYIHVWAVNDTAQPLAGTVTIQLFHPQRNQVRKEIVRQIAVPAGESRVVCRLDEAGIGSFRKEHILFAKLTDASGRVLATANCLGDIERRMTFPDARLDVRVDGGELVISSDKFARTVTLTGDEEGDVFGWFFSDNYFDLMPGEIKRVAILGDHQRGQIRAKAFYSPHQSIIDWSRAAK